MRLRHLLPKDAHLMLEWMHDEGTARFFRESFAVKTINDCMTFIDAAQDEKHSIHLAIVDDWDEYMGTVSLKNSGICHSIAGVRKRQGICVFCRKGSIRIWL